MTESVRELIARLCAEMDQGTTWLEIDRQEDGSHLVAGSVQCHAEAVEFDEDSGLHMVIPFSSLVALRYGRQGSEGGETVSMATPGDQRLKMAS